MKKIWGMAAAVFSIGLTAWVQASPYSEFIIPDSDVRILGAADTEALSLKELNYARNEIFARHSYEFKSNELRSYFNGKSWYEGIFSAEQFDDYSLTDIEKANIAFLRDEEEGRSPGGYQLDQAGGTDADVNVYHRQLYQTEDAPEVPFHQDAWDCFGFYADGNRVRLGLVNDIELYADHYFMFDMNQDGIPELLSYAVDDMYCMHWTIDCFAEGDLGLKASSRKNRMGNAGTGLYVLDGKYLVEIESKSMVGYDVTYERYYYMDESMSVHELEQMIYHENHSENGMNSSELTREFKLDGQGLSEEEFLRYFDRMNNGAMYYLSEDSDNI